MRKFDIRKFLTENKLTEQSKKINESADDAEKLYNIAKKEIRRGYLQRQDLSEDELYYYVSKYRLNVTEDEVEEVLYDIEDDLAHGR